MFDIVMHRRPTFVVGAL